MKIIVCVKQIPDVAELQFDPEKKVLIREGCRLILNPFDKRSITQAVKLREEHGGEIIVMTMGPPSATEALYECLAIGGDRAVHLVDRAFAGADTLATARALAAAIKRESFDLIICGRYSLDAETGQVGPEIAELLGIPHITAVCSLKLARESNRLVAERETDEGFETIECQLPALITAAERLIRPIKVKEPDIAAVRNRPIEVLTAANLAADSSLFGLAGSPTWVSEIITLKKSRQVEMIEGDVEQMAASLVERLCARGLFGGWDNEESKPRAAARDDQSEVAPLEDRAVWAVVELSAGKLRNVSLELLGKGKELARKLRGELAAVLIGDDLSARAGELAAYGVDRVYLIEGERFAQYHPLPYAGALAEAIERLKPHTVLIPSTANGRDYAPRVAARLGLGLTADCVDLDLNEQGELIQFKPAFGGQIVAPIYSRTWPQMATVRPGMLAKPEPNGARDCPIERLKVSPATDDRYRVVATTPSVGQAANELDDAEIVIGVGTGVGGPEQMPLIEALARALGAAIGGTRRVVDQGWLPRHQQIGLTGKAVAPRLYFGIGLSGNFNHTIGIQRSGIIAAINTDLQAAIFQTADYGMIADFKEAVPALTAALAQKRRQMGA
jgi:electron transfer flavoprotein alpha subunit